MTSSSNKDPLFTKADVRLFNAFGKHCYTLKVLEKKMAAHERSIANLVYKNISEQEAFQLAHGYASQMIHLQESIDVLKRDAASTYARVRNIKTVEQGGCND